MDTGDRKPDKLIEDIISFIKKERELYGDFSAVSPLAGNIHSDKKEGDAGSDFSDNLSSKPTALNSPVHPGGAAVKPEQQSITGGIHPELEGCKTLDELKKLCEQAGVLKTDLRGTNLVFGVGNPHAHLMLIGEAPGEQEDRQGEPFVGAAGKLLNKILAATGFKREEVYIANILKHRPPDNRNPKPEERERSLPFLLRQIDLINPRLILCLGKVAAQTLLESNESLGRMRGKFHKFRDHYELLVTYHPAALLRHESWKRPVWEDMQLLKKRYIELKG